MIWVVGIGFVLIVVALWQIQAQLDKLTKLLLAASDLNAEKLDEVRALVQEQSYDISRIVIPTT
jgi:hypothetical protein